MSSRVDIQITCIVHMQNVWEKKQKQKQNQNFEMITDELIHKCLLCYRQLRQIFPDINVDKLVVEFYLPSAYHPYFPSRRFYYDFY